MTLVFAGLRMQTPAERLCISVNMLQDHFTAIFEKVDVSEPPRAGGSWFVGYCGPDSRAVRCRPGSRVKLSK